MDMAAPEAWTGPVERDAIDIERGAAALDEEAPAPRPPAEAGEADGEREGDASAQTPPGGEEGPPRAPLDLPLPGLGEAAGRMAHVVGVRFRAGALIHSFDSGEEVYQRGDVVMVESESGPRAGTVAVGSGWVYTLEPLRRVLRRARPEEERGQRAATEREQEALRYCKDRVRERRLPLKLIRAEVSGRSGRATFYFASEERLDLRDLARDLTTHLRMRIELRQVGVRDEAKVVGGMGDCGRELCCSTWLPAFAPVSIRMAKDQGIVLNPSRLAGQCGRLKCCLVYEHDTYKELGKKLPKLGKRVNTPGGIGRVVEVDVLRQRVRISFEEGTTQTFPGSVVTPLVPPGPGGAQAPRPGPGPGPGHDQGQGPGEEDEEEAP
jgi:cell fate regulator YaaT (PSP1 superfamily)